MMDLANRYNIPELFKNQQKRSLSIRISIKERVQVLRKLQQTIIKNRIAIQEAVNKDLKKPFTEIDLSEIYPVLVEIKQAIKNIKRWAKPLKISTPITYLGTQAELVTEPKGVCLIISPWNYPFALSMKPLISCLAAGNTAIVKPSEEAPFTSELLSIVLAKIFPPDQVTVVQGDKEVATQLLEQPFNHVFFTGSPTVGKVVMQAAAKNLSSVTLELGGKSPAIVDNTAHISTAAKRIVFGKFINNGQTCIAPDYILVHQTVQEELLQELQKNILTLFGRGKEITEKSPDYSRIVNQKHFVRIQKLIQEAIDLGANKYWAGETNEQANYIPPVILTEVPLHARIMREEIFGPVLPVICYQNEEDVYSVIQNNPYPLALYIFSNQKIGQQKMISQIAAGTTCINDCVIQFTHPRLPFGGINHSGQGKSHGYYGFLAFSNQRSVLKQRSRFSLASCLYPPYDVKRKKIVNFLLKYF